MNHFFFSTKTTFKRFSYVALFFITTLFQGYSQAGAALDFDGVNDEVNMGDINAIDGLSQITIEGWVKADLTAPAPFPGIFSKSEDFRVYRQNSGGSSQVTFLIVNGGLIRHVSTSNNLLNNTWTHVAAVFDGTKPDTDKMKIYINGVLTSGEMVSIGAGNLTSLSSNADPVKIGSRSVDKWKGQLDEIRVWTRALCQAEISNNMNCEIPTTGEGLLMNYHFNQGLAGQNNSGITTLTDASGNNYDGTLIGFTLSSSTSNWISPGAVTTGTTCPTFMQSEMNIQAYNIDIADGDNTPSTSDHTDFGSIPAGMTSVKTYTIQNLGMANLNISDITSNNAAFTIGSLNPASPIAPNESANFDVTFLPTIAASYNATINIVNDDCDENPYNYSISGQGILATTSLTLSGADSSSLGTSTSFSANLLRTAPPAGPIAGQTVTFTIQRPDGQTNFSSVTTDASGNAIFNYTSSVAGVHTIIAQYFGNTSNAASTSNTLIHTVTAPEINVQGNGMNIVIGDNTPDVNDHTDFNGALIRTFTIQNLGNDNLNVTNITSSNPLFTIGSLTPASPITFPNGSASFTVIYHPNSSATETSTITVTNNDQNEDFYQFSISAPCAPPTITCPSNQTANTATGTCSATLTYADPTITGTPTPTLTYTFTGATVGSGSGSGSGSSFNKGVTTVTLMASNACVAPATCSFTVTVSDVEVPSITCAGTVTINTTNNLCTGTTSLINPTVNDNCLGSFGNALHFDGTNDKVNNITNVDLANKDFTIEAWLKRGSIGTWDIAVGAGTGCGGNQALYFGFRNNNTFAFTFYGNDTYTPTAYTDLDWHHWAATFNATSKERKIYRDGVLVHTNTSPSNFIGGTNITLGNTSCDNLPYHGLIDEVRVWSVERSQTQISSNMNNELSSQTGLIALFHMNQGTANDTNTGVSTAIDDSGGSHNGTLVDFTLMGSTSNWSTGQTLLPTLTNNAPSTYNKGNTTVTWTATDQSGNTNTCNQTVTVIDNQIPVITAPSNQTLNVITNTCAANYDISDPIADNCTGSTWSYSLSGATTGGTSGIADGTNSGSISFNKGTTTVTLNGVDASTNNAVQKTFTVTVNDNQAPSITCAGTVTVNTTSNLCTGTTVLTNPTITDNCQSENVLDFDGTNDFVSFTNNLNGVTNFTYEAWVYPRSNAGWQRILDFGNFAGHNIFLTTSHSGTGQPRLAINVNNTGEQLVTSPNALTLNTWSHIAVTIGGNMAKMYINGVLVATNNSFTYTPSSIGNTTNNWIGRSQYNDPYFNGRMYEVRMWNTTRTQTEIQNNMNSYLSAQPGLLAVYSLNQGVGNANNAGINTAIDGSGNNRTGTLSSNFALNGTTSNWVPKVSMTLANNAPSTYNKGNTTVTWIVTDQSGNTNACNQTVTVIDNQIPVITAPANQTLNVVSNSCTANYTIADPIADNCTGSTWSYSLSGATTGGTSGIADGTSSGILSFNKGTTTVTLNGVDASTNNAVQKTFTVTVNDIQVPSIICPANIMANTDPNSCYATVYYIAPIGTDNCIGSTTMQIAGLASGSQFSLGNNTLTFEVTDASGLKASCSFSITVNNANGPITIAGPEQMCPGGNAFYIPSVAGGSFASNSTEITIHPNSGEISNNGNVNATALITYTIVLNGCSTVSTAQKQISVITPNLIHQGNINDPMNWELGCVPSMVIPNGTPIIIDFDLMVPQGVNMDYHGDLIIQALKSIINNGTLNSHGGKIINNGTYKGKGSFIGNFENHGTMSPGN